MMPFTRRRDGADFVFDAQSRFLPQHETHTDTLHVFETFAGGYGGWSAALRVLTKFLQKPVRTIALDHDMSAVCQFALQHEHVIVDGFEKLPWNNAFRKCDQNIAIHADITMDTWWEPVNDCNVE